MHETATTPWHADVATPTPSAWARLSDLPVTIESVDAAQDSIEPRPGFRRTTTEVRLHGAGRVGAGRARVARRARVTGAAGAAGVVGRGTAGRGHAAESEETGAEDRDRSKLEVLHL